MQVELSWDGGDGGGGGSTSKSNYPNCQGTKLWW